MIFRVLWFLVIFLIPLWGSPLDRPSVKHEVYLEGTDYELHIYRIYGKEPGKKGLIVGGIQGDEPGGYLSADLYVDSWLERGDLIIVPRANFKSIILFNRGTDGDMNRRFIDAKKKHEMDQVIDIIKGLMAESDFFLHLHDGSGFYSPVYVNPLRNPNRWGQSVIVDAEVYSCGDKVLDLGKMAKRVVAETNKKIQNKKYHFEYFNTDTDNPETKYKEMKKTATYYALKNYCIPSFGLETSKNLPDDKTKILHKTYLINEFFKIFDLKPEIPEIVLPKPFLKHIVIKHDDNFLELKNGSVVTFPLGTKLMVYDIVSNYKRGLSCDILGFNGLNDSKIPFVIEKDTDIICRKDHHVIGKITLKIQRDNVSEKYFEVEVNGVVKKIKDGQKLFLSNGDQFVLKDFDNDPTIPVNLRGFVPKNVKVNDGDDRNILIPVDKALFMKRFSSDNGTTYEVIAGSLNQVKGKFFIAIDSK
ncbi:MAG: M14/M99 family metallopeptidase [Calditerrivibrio sp.]|nr:M14/M99 family metallopeptidase [Calditerrivibrio sp.]